MTAAKDAPIKPCKLCGKIRPLIESHIVPRWMYLRLTRLYGGQGGTNLVHTGNGVSILDPSQLKEYLLCEACEDRFRHWETYVSKISLQEDDSFPAFERVVRIPEHSSPDGVLADASALDCEAITRFAVSVFWRASVSTRKEVREVSLGPYEATIADCLRTDGVDLPTCATLTVQLVKMTGPNRADRTLALPYVHKAEGHHNHQFFGLGMVFSLRVGANVAVPDGLCFARSKRVYVSSGRQLSDTNIAMVQDNRPVGTIKKRLEAARRQKSERR